MGLFDFMKDSGKKIDVEENKGDAQLADDKIQELRNQRFTNNLNHEISELDVRIEDLFVSYDKGNVEIKGKTDSQADREKIILALGNVNGVSQVKDGIVVEKNEPESTLYTVKSGDTLSKIAKEHYGNAMKYTVIFEANKPMLDNPDKIYVGQVLRIPTFRRPDLVHGSSRR